MPETMRNLLTALMPDGGIWEPEAEADLDRLLNGMAENHEVVRSYLSGLAHMRDPALTTMLADLEREYGLVTNTTFSEADRRQVLGAQKGAKAETGGALQLQAKLTAAGFDLVVRQNNPVIDPNLFTTDAELVVNGDQFTSEPLYLAQANGDAMFAGNAKAVAGYFLEISQDQITYEIPTGPERWNYVFYVGGTVASWPPVFPPSLRGQVPVEKRDLLKRIILQHKPTHSWAGLAVDYV